MNGTIAIVKNSHGVLYLLLAGSLFFACNQPKLTKEDTIIESKAQINDAVAIQLKELLTTITDTIKPSVVLYNPFSIKQHLLPECKPTFTSKFNFTPAGISLKKFIDSTCQYYGLYSSAYHQKTINAYFTTLANGKDKNNAVAWAKAELYMTDAFFQIAKHINKGRLYNDDSKIKIDSSLLQQVQKPLLQAFAAQPTSLEKELSSYEPKFQDYDSLKTFLKQYLIDPKSVQKQYTTLVYTADSAAMIDRFFARIAEEGDIVSYAAMKDSANLAEKITQYQVAKNVKTTGYITQELVSAINYQAVIDPTLIALTLDKYKNKKVGWQPNYVLVNIPAFSLRAFSAVGAALESKVVVGRTSSKTPVMESEIAQIITMPNWYVPPSILKTPGYIERKRRNPNYVVKGNMVMQKSGANNALGQMKFNFKSSDAIYLHDTNEKWAFSARTRALSHGCVRVQAYAKLAQFINTQTPLVARDYKRVFDRLKIDSVKRDTTALYKYVVQDSTVYKDDVITGLLARKSHAELHLQQKVPVYIDYMTCAIRNGQYVKYNDVYGIDKAMMEQFLKRAK